MKIWVLHQIDPYSGEWNNYYFLIESDARTAYFNLIGALVKQGYVIAPQEEELHTWLIKADGEEMDITLLSSALGTRGVF